jgi:hypothetical protein
MDNKEELKRSLAEEEQRAKDSLANVEKMKKQLEELNKKEELPTVSATGVYLDNTMEYLYSLDYDNSILYQLSTNSNIDARITKLNLNNAFVKEEQAKQEALRREGQEFIRRCAMLWNKGNDWRKDLKKCQYFIYMDDRYELCSVENTNTTRGCMYFDTIELTERCIKELNEKYNKEQQKTIFGVI